MKKVKTAEKGKLEPHLGVPTFACWFQKKEGKWTGNSERTPVAPEALLTVL